MINDVFLTDLPGKVKTLAELEGELQHSKPEPVNQLQRMRMTPPTVPRSSPQPEGNDLSAFNKLISLMQAGTARPVESPKLTVSDINVLEYTVKRQVCVRCRVMVAWY